MNKNMRKMYTEEEIKDVINYAIEKGLIDNTKPIYYHPIYIASEESTGINESRMSLAILNNDPTPFTASTFLAYVKDLMDKGASLQMNGYFKSGGVIFNAYIMFYTTGNYRIYGNSTSDRGNMNLDSLGTTFIIADGVNKIN